MRYLIFLIISYSQLVANGHIFVYHRFGDTKYANTTTTIKELKRQFNYFKKHNYKVVPLNKIITKIKQNKQIPNNWVALTIDDTYKSFYTDGLEIFKQYHYPFSIYVYVKATNQKYSDYMSWEELKQCAKYGEVGLHSYTHAHLTHLTNQEIIDDTTKAIKLFKDNMGYKPSVYAYPYGEYDEAVKTTIKQFGFKAILNQNIGSVTKDTDIYDIPRIALTGKTNLEQKFKYKFFNVTWIKPQNYPKDNILKKIKAKVDLKHKILKLYITGYGWRNIKVKNGIIDENVNIHLTKARTRLMIGSDYFTISNKLITKEKE